MRKNTWNKQTLLTLAGMFALLAGLAAFFYYKGLAGKPIYLFAIITVAVIVTGIALVYLYLLSKGKIKQTGPDYRSLFFLGLMFFIFGSPENPAFYAIGLVFIIVALVNKKKWRPETKWNELSPAQRNFKIATLAILFFLVIGGLVMWYLGSQNKNNSDNSIEQSILSEQEARAIVESACIKGGESVSEGVYNSITKTWWFDANLNVTREGCNPACVVNEETKTAEINWRCTGLVPE